MLPPDGVNALPEGSTILLRQYVPSSFTISINVQ